MLRQVGVLKFDLGERHTDIVVKDVQIWTNNDTLKDEHQNDNVSIWSHSGRFMQYVDLNMLPLWLRPNVSSNNSTHICFTTSKATNAYFNSKLRDSRRGIVISFPSQDTATDSSGLWIFYRDEDSELNEDNFVKCFMLDLSRKNMIDTQIHDSIKNNSHMGRESSIDDILKKSQNRINSANNEVAKNVRINDRKLQFNETLSKLILGGLRLRGIPNTQSSFQRLYKMTFDASEFTHRNELKEMNRGQQPDIPFEELQETVETLLRLFTKS
ncbi:similar to Saccharomyces cerevisiae YOR060C SLD7 Protein with a role in chromosomal DNA replication [Maudiozyma saulgeensis]|uniref:Mitochondrial morphogenesis protein SLD7 n=1 Tax=Maudiozyma saulgeensis TaxID=1789683 RepID=A0A1X7QWR2_9SACH|nr:similar to Saccharomyces cerevisiae YOR060C SLD7 Protein with a role in chromosomal DNA replication [Kazachstania saulgeensis]